MTRLTWRGVLLAGFVFSGLGVAAAQEYRPGDQVVVIADTKLTVEGRGNVDDVFKGLVLKVQAVNGDWLWLNNGTPGWLDKKHVIPLDRAAIDRLTALIRNSSDVGLYNGRADVWRHLGELDIALADYNEAIRLDSQAVLYSNRGMVWNAKGEYDKAISDYSEAIRLNPEGATAYNNRGAALNDHKREHDKAIADYNEAIRLDPKYSTAYSNRGNAWSDKGDYDKAIADYNEALRLDPKYGDAYGSRGNSWYKKGDYDKAIADYDKAIELDPKDAHAYSNRGIAWSRKGNYDKAIADYNEALRLDPKNATAYINRGSAWRNKGDYDKAIADYNEALRLNPKYAKTQFNKGVAHFLQRQSTAIADFQAVIDLQGWSGSHAAYAVILGTLAAKLDQDAPRAQKFLDDSRDKLKPDWPEPIVRFLRGELDDKALLALATDNDKATEARCYLGLEHLARGHLDQAREHFTWVKQQGNRSFTEYTISVAELKRLAQP